MKFGKYKKVKKLLDTAAMRGLHEYNLKGGIDMHGEGEKKYRSYHINLLPKNGCIHCLNELFRDLHEADIYGPCYMSQREGGLICFC